LTQNMAWIAALDDYDTYCEEDSHVVLMEGGVPLCMTGFNGHQPGVVQIGGVYTPPDMRGLGLARRALALHLAQARGEGVMRAVLSAASPAAVRAYTAIGFRQTGVWSLCLFDPAEVVEVI
jgi:predicted GNAT family acetyltransferase